MNHDPQYSTLFSVELLTLLPLFRNQGLASVRSEYFVTGHTSRRFAPAGPTSMQYASTEYLRGPHLAYAENLGGGYLRTCRPIQSTRGNDQSNRSSRVSRLPEYSG